MCGRERQIVFHATKVPVRNDTSDFVVIGPLQCYGAWDLLLFHATCETRDLGSHVYLDLQIQ